MNKHFFSNISKMFDGSFDAFSLARKHGLLNIPAKHHGNGKLIDINEHQFVNMCSCSYLDLDTHPDIISAASQSIIDMGAVTLSVSRIRIHLSLLNEVEEKLSSHLNCHAYADISCSSATCAVLPLIASGCFSNMQKPVMIFDRFAHFSMNYTKPICADETIVMTSEHNDVNYIEDQCKKNKLVAYVADGAYSMGGHAPLKELIQLQDKYGLMLYFDDSHSLTSYGDNAEGYVRSHLPELNDRTFIVSSLGKAFGACGGVIMYGSPKFLPYLETYKPWTQTVNAAGMGAILASIEVQKSAEFKQRKLQLENNISTIDQHFDTVDKNNGLPIRVLPVNTPENAIICARSLLDEGYYTSPVFFPIVPKGTAGLRVMIRASMDQTVIDNFSETAKRVIIEHG